MKKFIAILISAVMAFASAGTVAAAGVNAIQNQAGIFVNGEKVEFSNPPMLVSGRNLVPVRSIFEKLGAEVEWHPENSTVTVKNEQTDIVMRIGYTAATVNNRMVRMDVPPLILNNYTMIPLRFIAETLMAEVGWNPQNGDVSIVTGKNEGSSRGDYDRDYYDQNSFAVVIDAGHGGLETGANYFGVMEKNLNLAISKKLNELLQAEGIKTYMTRTGDSTVSLYDRSGLANSVNADLFVSVHNNAGSAGTTGTMTLYYPGSSNSKGKLSAQAFASIVQSELVGMLGSKNLGVIARPNLAVLRTANMPAVIAEVGYMSNAGELTKLLKEDYQQKTAEALKNAVLKALNRM